jgi:hypothetical protein
VLSDFPALALLFSLVYPSRRHLAPRTRLVLEFILEQVRQVLVCSAGAGLWPTTKLKASGSTSAASLSSFVILSKDQRPGRMRNIVRRQRQGHRVSDRE